MLKAHRAPQSIEPSLGSRGQRLRFAGTFVGAITLYFLLTLAVEFPDATYAARYPTAGWLLTVNEAVRHSLVLPYQHAIAVATAGTVNLLGYAAVVDGRDIHSRDFSVTITGGCDAIELTLLFLAAVAAYPADPARKLVGLMAGVVAIAALNLLRVVSLWLIGVQWRSAFDLAHFTLWPFVLLCATMLLFARWLQFAAHQTAADKVS